ncbi:hypothetical protein ACR78H_12245 [Sphingobacterium siyangense]|uniref:hypothetical protein n=2 Tax=Sphingobacterium siyangense TaxID=459529 RepID=UPI003DA3F206
MEEFTLRLYRLRTYLVIEVLVCLIMISGMYYWYTLPSGEFNMYSLFGDNLFSVIFGMLLLMVEIVLFLYVMNLSSNLIALLLLRKFKIVKQNAVIAIQDEKTDFVQNIELNSVKHVNLKVADGFLRLYFYSEKGNIDGYVLALPFYFSKFLERKKIKEIQKTLTKIFGSKLKVV